MTYSIVAYDPETKQFGVAVQTHVPSVGNGVPWVKPGVGAIATQSMTNIGFGPLGLELLAGGVSAENTLAALLASDPGADQRQVSVIDKDGKVATYTGERCIPFAGHRTGDNYSVQSNMMAKDTVPDAMVKAFESAQGELMHRMMVALEAAEAEGGDIRGSQSAAMLVYGNEDKPDWENMVCDLRVDEHADPIGELRRMVDLERAYLVSIKGYQQAKEEDIEGAITTFAKAREMSPDSTEMTFWQAVTLADTYDRIEEGRALLESLFAAEPQWKELLTRLAPVGIIEHPEIVDKLLGK